MLFTLAKTYMTATRQTAIGGQNDVALACASQTIPARFTPTNGSYSSEKSDNIIRRLWQRARRIYLKRQHLKELNDLDDHLLHDIGVEREQLAELLEMAPDGFDLVRASRDGTPSWHTVRTRRPGW